MKLYLDKDELYPLYSLYKSEKFNFCREVDVPEDLYENYLQIMERFWDVQEQLSQLDES